MQITMKYRNRIRKTALAFGSFIAILLALICPSFPWQASAQDSMDDDMEMRPFLRPIGRVGALVDDGFIANTSIDPSYTRLDYPNAKLTVAYDINNAGNIVGFYQDASLNVHGFLYNRAPRSFASIDYDNSVCTTGTDARGINERGDIVGTYIAGGVQHAFVRRARGRGNQ